MKNAFYAVGRDNPKNKKFEIPGVNFIVGGMDVPSFSAVFTKKKEALKFVKQNSLKDYRVKKVSLVDI